MSLPKYGSWVANTSKKLDVSWGHEPTNRIGLRMVVPRAFGDQPHLHLPPLEWCFQNWRDRDSLSGLRDDGHAPVAGFCGRSEWPDENCLLIEKYSDKTEYPKGGVAPDQLLRSDVQSGNKVRSFGLGDGHFWDGASAHGFPFPAGFASARAGGH